LALSLCVGAAARDLERTVPTIELRNGIKVPVLAFGTGDYMDNNTASRDGVARALGAGFRHVDVSPDYINLIGVGWALKASDIPRDELFVSTKVEPPSWDNPYPTFDYTMAQARMNLEQLGVEYVDLVVLHYPPWLEPDFHGSCDMPQICKVVQEQWRALEAFYNAGLARAIGVSNFCPVCLKCLEQTQIITPMINSREYHVGMGRDPHGTFSYCEERGIKLSGYSPLAHGKLLHNFTVGEEIAKKYGVSSVQVALAYLAQRGIVAITSGNNPAHLRSDLDLWGFALSQEDYTKLDALTEPACYPYTIHHGGYCC
jgi:2,5-diketo-D-gluconate reductase A